MTEINLAQVEEFVARYGTVKRLIEAAAAVANAIHVGTGGMIKGSMMEQELRDALILKRGEIVNIPKQSQCDWERRLRETASIDLVNQRARSRCKERFGFSPLHGWGPQCELPAGHEGQHYVSNSAERSGTESAL